MVLIIFELLILFSLDYIPKTEEEDIVFTLAMVIIHIIHGTYSSPLLSIFRETSQDLHLSQFSFS